VGSVSGSSLTILHAAFFSNVLNFCRSAIATFDPLTVTVLPISLTAPLFSRWRPARPSWQQEQHLEVTVQFLTSRFVQYDVD
jgi:hypothetical protein